MTLRRKTYKPLIVFYGTFSSPFENRQVCFLNEWRSLIESEREERLLFGARAIRFHDPEEVSFLLTLLFLPLRFCISVRRVSPCTANHSDSPARTPGILVLLSSSQVGFFCLLLWSWVNGEIRRKCPGFQGRLQGVSDNFPQFVAFSSHQENHSLSAMSRVSRFRWICWLTVGEDGTLPALHEPHNFSLLRRVLRVGWAWVD